MLRVLGQFRKCILSLAIYALFDCIDGQDKMAT